MNAVRSFVTAAWDLLVGDDWRLAAGVAVAIGVSALVAAAGLAAWPIMPVAVIVLLTFSIRRATR